MRTAAENQEAAEAATKARKNPFIRSWWTDFSGFMAGFRYCPIMYTI
jgi:hypothetical protein